MLVGVSVAGEEADSGQMVEAGGDEGGVGVLPGSVFEASEVEPGDCAPAPQAANTSVALISAYRYALTRILSMVSILG